MFCLMDWIYIDVHEFIIFLLKFQYFLCDQCFSDFIPDFVMVWNLGNFVYGLVWYFGKSGSGSDSIGTSRINAGSRIDSYVGTFKIETDKL